MERGMMLGGMEGIGWSRSLEWGEIVSRRKYRRFGGEMEKSVNMGVLWDLDGRVVGWCESCRRLMKLGGVEMR